jgi:molybdenum cofactor biosynthesis protein B
MEREFIKIKVAVMLVSDAPSTLDEATGKLVVDRLSDAGHEVWPVEVVKDSEVAVRKQIDSWIDFSDVDVIVAISGFETDAMTSALAPLITKQLTGFSDLFRLLTYREIGTAAMLTEVIAAQCGHAFVFALPAARGAVATALDKLLVPQLDARTRPRNLVMRMPRHKSKVPVAGPNAFPKEETPSGVPPPPRAPTKTMPPPLPRRATHSTPPLPMVAVPRTISDPNIAELDPTQIVEEPTSLPGISIASLEDAIERSIEASGTELPPKLADNNPAVIAAREHAEKTPEAQAAAWVSAVEEAASKVIKRAAAEREARLSGEHKVPDLPAEEPEAVKPEPKVEPKVEVKFDDEPRGKIEKASGAKPSAKPDRPVDQVAAVIVDDPELVERRAKAASISPPRSAKPAVESTELPVFAAREATPAPDKPKRGWMVVAGLALIGAVFLLINVVGKTDGAANQRTPIDAGTPLVTTQPVVEPPPPTTGGGLLGEPDAPPPDAEQAIEMDPALARVPKTVPRTPKEGSANPDDPDLTKAPNNPTATDECDEVSCMLSKYDRPCCERFRPPPVEKPPVVVVDPDAGPVELDKTLIKVGVERFRAMVIRCGEQVAAKGTVSVAVVVKPDGNVQSVSVASTPDAALGDCVAGVMRKATFAKTQHGGSFTYPFAF